MMRPPESGLSSRTMSVSFSMPRSVRFTTPPSCEYFWRPEAVGPDHHQVVLAARGADELRRLVLVLGQDAPVSPSCTSPRPRSPPS